jgi:hypothetical protein
VIVEALLGNALMYCVSVVVKVWFPEYSVANFVIVYVAVVIGQVLLLVRMGLPDVTAVLEE